jgi:hypothetical protein
MKKKLTLVTFAAAFAAMFGLNLDMAAAQFGAGPRLGNQVYEPDSFRRVAADLNVGLPGRLWVSTNFAEEGLGYTGSYVTVGGKRRLFEDFLDGRWLTEARLHHSIEDNGGFFANVGVERVFSIKAAEADVVTGFWYDFDGDQQGNFGHDFSQVSVNAAIKTRRWDLVGNGYFPVGVRNFTSEATVGGTFFQGNNIVLQQGIDSSLTGFDVTLRLRPKQLAFMNGSFEVGGYGYSSDLINSFGGGRVRLNAQGRRGLIFGAEVNHDDRFQTTGSLSVGYVFGAVGGTNSEYAGIGRDLEETNRNDHIVRFNQSVELAIDPFTGAPYNVVHVADGAADGGDGTAENPFDTLADVQANSEIGDVIFVAAGGTLDGGLVLQDRQLLLGEGTEQLIDIQDGLRFRLGADTGGGAVLTNNGGSEVVRLADNNIVRGITIDATGANVGIAGDQADSGILEDNVVTNASEFGIRLNLARGGFDINNNTLNDNGVDGLFVQRALDPTAIFNVNNNIANGNGFEGIQFEDFQAQQLNLTSNTTSNNGRHGLFLSDYLTNGGEINILSHISDSNAEQGILIERGDGNLNILDATVTNNIGGGILTDTFTNQTAGQSTLIGNSEGGVSTITGNGVGAGSNLQFNLTQAGAVQDALVTGLSLDNGGRGILASVEGIDTRLNLNVIDNISISENLADGIRLIADDGGTINATIANDGLPLIMTNNGQSAGGAIFVSANGTNGIPASQINTTIRNVDINLPGSTANATGISVNSNGNASTNTIIENADIEKSLVTNVAGFPVDDGDIGIDLDFANNGANAPNVVNIDNTRIVTDNGITLDVGANTLADVSINSSTIQAVSTVLPAEGARATNAPFTDGLSQAFGAVGIRVQTFGDVAPTVDSLTRLTITDVLLRDFAGDVFPTRGNAGGANGLGFAPQGSAVDIATFGDSNLLLDFRNNRVLNNGAGFNNDADNDGAFNDQPVNTNEDPNNLLFVDAVRINAFDDSTISTRIVNNLFQDNFERGLALGTFGDARINASVINNAFDGNDRGQDGDNIVPNSDPAIALDDDGFVDFEAINNDEFFFRPFENPFSLDGDGNVIDTDMDDIADFLVTDGIAPGNANFCLDLSNNLFQLGTIIADFSAGGDFELGLDGATNGFTAPVAGTTTAGFGICDALISAEELLFSARGFSQPAN